MNYYLVWALRFWKSWFTPLAANDPYYTDERDDGERLMSSGHERPDNVVSFNQPRRK